MKKQLLFAAALFAATFGVNAQQVSSVAELKAAIEEAVTAEVEVTIANSVTLDFQTELNEEEKAYSINIPESVTSLTVAGDNSNVILKSQFLKPTNKMEKLEIKGVNFSSPVTNDNYVLNLDAEDINIDFLNIENCTATTMRGFFRIKDHESIHVGHLSINNCVVTNIGSYNFVHLDKGTINTLEVINNTIHDFDAAGTRLIRFVDPAEGDQVRLTNFIMRKNTLNNVIASGSYIADFGKVGGSATPITGDFIFTDNLLGTSVVGTSGTTKAFSKVDYDTYESEDNYIASDWKMEGVEKFFTELTITSDELFPDAENGNFTISSDAVYKEAGDPRWNGTEPVESIYDAGEGPGTSIDTIDGSAEIVATEYYDISGLKYSVAPKGLVIVKNILSDGSVKVTKTYNK